MIWCFLFVSVFINISDHTWCIDSTTSCDICTCHSSTIYVPSTFTLVSSNSTTPIKIFTKHRFSSSLNYFYHNIFSHVLHTYSSLLTNNKVQKKNKNNKSLFLFISYYIRPKCSNALYKPSSLTSSVT